MDDEVIIGQEIEQQIIKEWETISICNDFVFCKVMQDKGLLAEQWMM